MKTGEGKTLVATLPAYLNALTGGQAGREEGARKRGREGERADPALPLWRRQQARQPARLAR